MSDGDLCTYNSQSKSQHTAARRSLLRSVISSIRGLLSGAGARMKNGGICRAVWNNKAQPCCWCRCDLYWRDFMLWDHTGICFFPSLCYKCEDGLTCTICLRQSLTSLHQVDTYASS